MVQTGAKTQLGGLKKGLLMVGYQLIILERVGILDKNPTERQTKTAIAVLAQLLFFKILFSLVCLL